MTDVKQVVEDLNRDWEEFKREHSQAIADGKEADVLLTEKVDRINDALTQMSEDHDNMVKAEKLNEMADQIREMKEYVYSPSFQAAEEKGEDAHVKAFCDWMVKGDRVSAETKDMLETKDVTIGTANAGGHAVPAPIAAEIFQKVIDISPIAGAVLTTQTNTGLYERLVDVRGTTSGWAGETDTRSETAEATLRQVTFTHGELYAVQRASNWSLNDIFFDVEAWLTQGAAEEFANQLGAAITTGNGTNRPTGIVGTPESNADFASPERTFGEIQYLPTGRATGFQLDYLTGSPQGDPWGVFIDLLTAFKPAYLSNAQFSFRRATEAVLRKLRDQDANYYWAPAVAAGLPNTLWGYNILPNENVAAIAADAIPVLFGDFRRGYELLRWNGMTAIRDEVTVKGQTLFYVAQRFGGNKTNDDAIKCIKCAVS